jgi:hypothetical protein
MVEDRTVNLAKVALFIAFGGGGGWQEVWKGQKTLFLLKRCLRQIKEQSRAWLEWLGWNCCCCCC